MVWNKYILINNNITPAPCLEITAMNPRKNYSISLTMLIDTGASRTAIPLSILYNDLQVHHTTDRVVQDFDGKKHILRLFIVDLIVQANTFHNVCVIGTENNNTGCLGRDILARHFLRCDGPGKKYELDYV